MILTIKTDQPTAELSLVNNSESVDSIHWHAHRELANTILSNVSKLLEQNSVGFDDLSGLVVYKGPGSFTGLRIGATVANTLAYSLDIPVVGTSSNEWVKQGIQRLSDNHDDKIVKPVYGGEPNITKPRK